MSAPDVGLATRLPIEILNNLYTSYSVISMADLSQNYNRLKAQFGINLPIEGLFWNIQDAVDLANAVGAPHTPLQILNAA